MSGLGTKAALSHKVDYNKTYRKGKGAQVRAANCAAFRRARAAPHAAAARLTRTRPAARARAGGRDAL